MNTVFETTGYTQVLQRLSELAITKAGARQALDLKPERSELNLRKQLADTAQAKEMLEIFGAPPLPAMERTEEWIGRADAGDLLSALEMEEIGTFLASVGRMIRYLDRGCERQISLAFYRENLDPLSGLQEEIQRCIRNGRVDDAASPALRDARRRILLLEEKIREKAESILRSQKNCMAEGFTVMRNGSLCLPVKKECKSKVPGRLVDKSSTGATLFIEPAAVAALQQDLELCRLKEENEERIVLYTLLSEIADQKVPLLQNIRTLEKLDFVFAKGKLALDMDAVEPAVNTEGYLSLKEARHPALPKEAAVPLTFSMGRQEKGIVITGPNTGGKTVTIKTAGLFVLLAGSGLFVPCREADICLCDRVLSDIGDGQNIADNLSTFSAHITNIIHILERISPDSLVLLDEPGSGTDPAEGMGIAIAVLEQLKASGCLFLVTTHYPEVKTWSERTDGVTNARMAFDRDNLRPLYRLEMGESGESCALYIAKRLGMPEEMLEAAALATYGEHSGPVLERLLDEPALSGNRKPSGSRPCPRASSLERKSPRQSDGPNGNVCTLQRGDSVAVWPEGITGIVVRPADDRGDVLVQIRKEKRKINHKRLTLRVAASELYPEDYDFSIVFDTVENRKARHRMRKGHQEGLIIRPEDPDAF